MPGDEVISAARYRVLAGLSIPPKGSAEPTFRAPREHPEEDLQRAAVELIGYVFARRVRVFHPANGGDRNPIVAAKLKAQGVSAGVPDLVVLLPNGRTGYIELKSDVGHLTKPQREWRDWLQANRHPWALCRTTEEVLAAISGWMEREERCETQ